MLTYDQLRAFRARPDRRRPREAVGSRSRPVPSSASNAAACSAAGDGGRSRPQVSWEDETV